MRQRSVRFKDLEKALELFRLRARYGNRIIPDDGDCEEFASLEEARQEALQEIGELSEMAVSTGKPSGCDSIEVTDPYGTVVLRVPAKGTV